MAALHHNESELFDWDGGKVRFIASSEETGGRRAVIEVTERPGYKTPVHRHNYTDEEFYVLEGVLTVKITDKTSEPRRFKCFDSARNTPRTRKPSDGPF